MPRTVNVLAFTVTAIVLILFLVVIQTSILKNGPSPKSHEIMLKLASSSGVVRASAPTTQRFPRHYTSFTSHLGRHYVTLVSIFFFND